VNFFSNQPERRSIVAYCGGFQPMTSPSLSANLPFTPPGGDWYSLIVNSVHSLKTGVKSICRAKFVLDKRYIDDYTWFGTSSLSICCALLFESILYSQYNQCFQVRTVTCKSPQSIISPLPLLYCLVLFIEKPAVLNTCCILNRQQIC